MGSQAEALDAEKQIGPALEKIGARLVAVSHQTFGLAEFQRKYFRGDIYLDIDKDMYKAFGSQHGGADDIAKPGVMEAGRKAYKMLKAKDPSYKLDSTGEGALLGGSQYQLHSNPLTLLFGCVFLFGHLKDTDRVLTLSPPGRAQDGRSTPSVSSRGR